MLNIDKLPTRIINGKRHYVVPNGEAYPSITTVLSAIPNPDLEAWRKSVGEDVADYIKVSSGIRGNILHEIVNDYLSGQKSRDILKQKYPKLLPFALFENIREELDKITNIRVLEKTLWSDELKVAGRVDCVADYNGEPSVIDFKTARKIKDQTMLNNYYLQVTAYTKMYHERTGEKINNTVILMTCESGEKGTFSSEPDWYMDELKQVISNYYTPS